MAKDTDTVVTRVPAAVWVPVELSTGETVEFTDVPSKAADLIESGALTDRLSAELATVMLVSCVADKDIKAVTAFAEADAIAAIAIASAVRVSVVRRQTALMAATLEDFGHNNKADDEDPKAS